MRTIHSRYALSCSTDSLDEPYGTARGELRVHICGPSDRLPDSTKPTREPWPHESIVVLYLDAEDGEHDGAEIKVRWADLLSAVQDAVADLDGDR